MSGRASELTPCRRLFSGRRRRFPSRRRRLHIVGCQRSGTTLLMELLWACYDFGGRTEHEQSLFEPIPTGGGVFLTKKPPDSKFLQRAFARDDELFVIAMLRDPRAVITSRHPSRRGVYYSNFYRWSQHADLITSEAEHERFHVVRFEDLITKPQVVQDQLEARFVFLERTRDFSGYPFAEDIPVPAQESLGGVRGFDPSRLADWHQHLPRIKRELQLNPQMPQRLQEFGYTKDNHWLGVLEAVEPLQQAYKEHPPHYFRTLETRFRYWWRTQRYLHVRRLAWWNRAS